MTNEQTEPAGSEGGGTITVRRNASTNRFEALLDGTVVGFIDYHQHGDRVTLIHTETDPYFEGRGIGSTLARAALEDVQARGEKAVIVCPFITAYLKRHPDYDDIVVRAE
ncbi:MAG TPA: GNAT family N-acetyltransferase [Micromonosporaceae bacterium]|jgi:hypothetical protein